MTFFCIYCFFKLSCSKEIMSSQVRTFHVSFKIFTFKKQDTIEVFLFHGDNLCRSGNGNGGGGR